ncbi:hypothetical protein DFR66_1148 [Flavobacterium glaciei]|uniref:Uncharacterized protein n=1 Tax=Flavobacterium glaciei TaxID=386300 RepID=A0ABX9HWT5_9FLAO|nr:hypothetical protein DFR66_1148 [Flavobacterium glaciei]
MSEWAIDLSEWATRMFFFYNIFALFYSLLKITKI